jgi:peptide/nickel transport system substrate-binding protein
MTDYPESHVDLKDFLLHSKLTRRQTLGVAAGLAAGAMGADFLAACTTPPSSGPPKPFLAPVPLSSEVSVMGTPRNQTMVVDQSPQTTWDSWNYFIPNGSNYYNGFGQVCTEFLWYLNVATGKLVPWLATGYSYNSDFTKFTMNLNPKAHWSDGKPFTSKDVAFSINMLNENPSLLNSTPTANSEAKTISTPDDHTVVIDLNVADPRYHYNFICGIVAGFYVMPEHIWSGQDPTTFKFNPPVMTGPYKLYNTNSNAQVVGWVKDPNYWNIGTLNPAPKYAAWRAASTDLDVAFEQFKAGITDYGSDFTHVSTLVAQGDKSVEILTKFLDPCERAILINTKSPSGGGILQDYRMRWVVSMLIDRERIAQNVWVPATEPGVYPWAAYPGNKKWEVPSIAKNYPLSYNPTKAEQMLDTIGATKGSNGQRTYKGQQVTLDILTGTLPSAGDEYSIGQLLAQELTNVGIQSSIKYLGSSALTQQMLTGEFDMLSRWLCGELIDPYQLYSGYLSKYAEPIGTVTSVQSAIVRLTDPQLDTAVGKLQGLAPTNPAATPYFHDALNRWYSDMAAVPIIQTVYTQQFNLTYWKDWPTNENIYTVPDNWWGQWLFVMGKVKPTGTKQS